MTALRHHSDLFRYGPESEAEPIALGIKEVVLGANEQIVQSKCWYERGATKNAPAKSRSLVSYVLDGFFEIEVDGKTQILGPSGSFIVPFGADHTITCLEDGVILGVLAAENNETDRSILAAPSVSMIARGGACSSKRASTKQLD